MVFACRGCCTVSIASLQSRGEGAHTVQEGGFGFGSADFSSAVDDRRTCFLRRPLFLTLGEVLVVVRGLGASRGVMVEGAPVRQGKGGPGSAHRREDRECQDG